MLTIVVFTGMAFAQLRVVVSIEPYREAVQRLVGDEGTVDVLLPAGASPHGFDPTPRDVVRLSDADLVVVNGVADDWTLDLVEALGAESLLHLRVGGDRMILRGGADSRVTEGQTLHFGADRDGVTFFDANERAMDTGAPAMRAVK